MYHIVLDIPNIYLITGYLCLLTACIQSPTTTTSGNHKSDLFFYEFVCLFSKYSEVIRNEHGDEGQDLT